MVQLFPYSLRCLTAEISIGIYALHIKYIYTSDRLGALHTVVNHAAVSSETGL